MMSNFKKNGEVIGYIEKYLKFLLKISTDPDSSSYVLDQDLFAYWNKILLLLKNRVISFESKTMVLMESEDFWPQTNHGMGYNADANLSRISKNNLDAPNLLQNLQHELDEELLEKDIIFVSREKDKERNNFVPLKDITEGKFVVIRPIEEFESILSETIWICRAMGSIQIDPSQSNCGEFPME